MGEWVSLEKKGERVEGGERETMTRKVGFKEVCPYEIQHRERKESEIVGGCVSEWVCV